MDKRFLLTILLCFAISVIYMDLITPDRTPQDPPAPTASNFQEPLDRQLRDDRTSVETPTNIDGGTDFPTQQFGARSRDQ